jgi:hypothetical protein
MTNLERWRFYQKDAPSPDSWVDMTWYFTCSAALQRRVWLGNLTERPLFPNLYIVLIGHPGLGKSFLVNPAQRLLRHWANNPDDQSKDFPTGVKRKDLIETAPDDFSYQQFLKRLSEATRRFTYPDNGKPKPYTHASMALVLSDMTSLFKKNADQVAKCLLKCYDCEDYEYETKHQGKDYIRHTCVNMLAGATPTVLKEAASYNIFDDGFTSRIIFCFDYIPRHENFWVADINDEQQAAFPPLLEHVKKLAGLFGRVQFDPSVHDYLQTWYTDTHLPVAKRASPKMQNYYARTRVHVQKLAMAIHFSESYEMIVGLDSVKKAIELLTTLEKKMSVGFNSVGRNILHGISKDITKFLAAMPKGANKPLLLANFNYEVTLPELDEILDALQMSGQIKLNTDGNYVTGT